MRRELVIIRIGAYRVIQEDNVLGVPLPDQGTCNADLRSVSKVGQNKWSTTA